MLYFQDKQVGVGVLNVTVTFCVCAHTHLFMVRLCMTSARWCAIYVCMLLAELC